MLSFDMTRTAYKEKKCVCGGGGKMQTGLYVAVIKGGTQHMPHTSRPKTRGYTKSHKQQGGLISFHHCLNLRAVGQKRKEYKSIGFFTWLKICEVKCRAVVNTVMKFWIP
jgi:hypothetical protein